MRKLVPCYSGVEVVAAIGLILVMVFSDIGKKWAAHGMLFTVFGLLTVVAPLRRNLRYRSKIRLDMTEKGLAVNFGRRVPGKDFGIRAAALLRSEMDDRDATTNEKTMIVYFVTRPPLVFPPFLRIWPHP